MLGRVCGADVTTSGLDSLSASICSMMSMNWSRTSFDSVSVGSTISASLTISGKYIVGAWMPFSSNRFAMSSALVPRSDWAVADSTVSCMQ